MRAATGLTLLRHYDRRWLRGDLLAGVTVAAYLVPQVMAYAAVAGLPPIAGLWAAMAALVAYAVLGTSRRLSVGPESTTALLTAVAIGPLAGGDARRYAALAAVLAVMMGLVCLLAWLAHLGFLADALSRPVLVGYMAGVAVLMVVSQLHTLTGVSVDGDSFVSDIGSFARHLHEMRPATPLLAFAILVFLLVVGRLAPRAPVPLLGVAVAVIAASALGLEDSGVELVGSVPSGLPAMTFGLTMGDIRDLVFPALGLAVVGYSDNILTGRAFADRHHEQIDAEQELLALGVANIAAGAVHGLPVSSSGSRTAIADAVGARSQLSSLVTVSMVGLTLVLLGRVLADFPKAALGALVVWAAIRLVDVAEFRRIGRFRRTELALALGTTVSVLFFNVLVGILIAIGLSILDLLRRVARPHDGILGFVPNTPGMHDIDDFPDARVVDGLLVYRYDSPLFFANADNFLRRALAAVGEARQPLRWFILNAEANVQIDITALDALDELRRRLEEQGVVFALARVKHELYLDLERGGLIKRIGRRRVYATLPTAVDAYARWYEKRMGTLPSGLLPTSREDGPQAGT
jgi:high affinity sulfate transporter 1